MVKSIKYYMIDEYVDDKVGSDITTDDIKGNEEARKRIYQFTSLLFNPLNNKLYCGVTNFDSDILHEFNIETKQFTSLNYRDRFKPRTKYDIKIHRSLEFDQEQNLSLIHI